MSRQCHARIHRSKECIAAGSVMNAMIMFVKNRPLVDPMLGPLFYHVDSLTGEALVYNKGGFPRITDWLFVEQPLTKPMALPASVNKCLAYDTSSCRWRQLGDESIEICRAKPITKPFGLVVRSFTIHVRNQRFRSLPIRWNMVCVLCRTLRSGRAIHPCN